MDRKSINYVEKYEKYKNAVTATNKIRFISLYAIPESPYYDKLKYEEMMAELAKTEPLANYHLFVQSIIMQDYYKAFEHFKLFDPYIIGYGDKFLRNRELFEYCVCRDPLFNHFKSQMTYLRRKTTDHYAECKLCAETPYRFCTHYKLIEYDIAVLNILRLAGNKFECPICYENKPYATHCGGTCFDNWGHICCGCISDYEKNKFENFFKCSRCKNFWCRDCAKHVKRCPFCREML